MTLTRLFSATLAFCSLPLFAQVQLPSNSSSAANSAGTRLTPKSLGELSEPWQIVPHQSDPDTPQNPMDHIRIDQFHFDQGKSYTGATTFTFKVAPGWDGSLDGGATCYTMRSYVVARDSKDSDSTHITGYSTCQPAARYGVKTAVEGPLLLER
jgi:hypothetical protein